jgi:hypothetical protein
MADEVKVKFGGDFSGLAKGAGSAVKAAGTAMASAYKDITHSIGGHLLAAMGVSTLLHKFTEGVMESLHYFHELELAIKKVGGSSEEFQRLAGVAKVNGVAFDELARSMNMFNREIGKADKGSKGVKDTLLGLRYTEEEIRKGTITATDVMGRLGDRFKELGDQGRLTDDVMILFGKSGANLIPIFKDGSEALRELTKEAKVYSEQTIEALAKVDKAISKGQRQLTMTFIRNPLEAYANYTTNREYDKNVKASLDNAVEAGRGFGIDKRGKYAAQQLYGDITGEYKSAEDLKEVIKRLRKDEADMQKAADMGRGLGVTPGEDILMKLEAYKIVLPQLMNRMAMAAAQEKAENDNKLNRENAQNEVKPEDKGKMNGKNTLTGSFGDIGSPDGNVVGVGRNLQFSMMKEQLDVLKEINDNIIKSSSPEKVGVVPDFTKVNQRTNLS